ncbi:NACHT domain-containing protein [Streptomyces millisiae]|uniref:NACHT domain-containing protein n=1 Tax=Streptomyces millisiae TaxID=3075542 RepID=A0ABU2LVA3_9ACTN|nr:NACHT domain-containing protein [Streptomyces sp. DSM 44918]MDT0321509.1 NACHT domain-containing protein [Streptomyces sp. DSM 44918]
MDIGTTGLRLASSAVAPLVKRLFRQDGPGAGLVDKPVRLSSLVSFRGEKRTLTDRDVEKLATELTLRAAKATGPHDTPLELDRIMVADLLARSLQALGDLDMDDVQAVRLGPDALARALRQNTDELSSDATVFYDRVLALACLHVLDFFTKRSTFVARTLVEQTRQQERIIHTLDLLVERVSSQSAEDAAFEDRYRNYLVRRHNKLTIFGIDVDDEWPLDDAYLSLETTERAPVHGGGDGIPTPPQRAERALSGRHRVLLRGVAGSGKTTLVQWLAVTTAEHRLSTELSHLIGLVPFVLPMRTLTRAGQELPMPEDFLTAVRCPHTPPRGWVERVLANDRGLLLIDGIDEIPEQERDRTRAWLRELLREFPGSVCVVTARPSAVREDWLAADDFTELSLAPMNRKDVTAFVQRWHRAAEADETEAEALLTAIRSRPDLSRLATNPLMCGLICALHRTSHGYLPRGREALYDAALRMLLERRDQQRKIDHGLRLDAPSQTLLLQRLAYWLIRNGHSELDREDALDLISQVLPSMPQVSAQGDAEAILRHLLDRSGLLLEPTEGALTFVHRTFQDYLAAREAIEARDFPLLIKNAHLDQWEDVIRMAVAHGRPAERARLLKGLIKRGDTVKKHRIRLHLLAMACLEHATQLDPAVQEMVTSRAAELIPPVNWREAQALAAAGDVVLELLPGPEQLALNEAWNVIHTITQVGGDAALKPLARFCDHPSRWLTNKIAGAWGSFDIADFADTVIPKLPADAGISVSTVEQLAHPCVRGRRLRASNVDPDDLVRAGVADQVESLSYTRPVDLARLTCLSRVTRLKLYFKMRSADLGFLAQLPLTNLDISLDPAMEPKGIHLLHSIGEFIVRLNRTHHPLRQLPPGAPVTWLILDAPAHGLDELDDFPRLTDLSLWGREASLTTGDWQRIANLEKLAQLYLYPKPLRSLPPSLVFPSVTQLHVLSAAYTPIDLEALVRAFPAIQTLRLMETNSLDVSPLGKLPSLRKLRLEEARGSTNWRSLRDVELVVTPAPRYGSANVYN